jgi:ATP-dependent DNA helicase RecG
MSTSSTPAAKLTQPVQFIKGVGPHKAKWLEKLGLKTAADVLFFFPRKYQDFRELTPIGDLESDQNASVLVEVAEVEAIISSTGKPILYVLFKDETGFIRGIWFGQSFLKDRFALKQRVLLRGKAVERGLRFQMTHPKVTWVESGQEVSQGQLLPVYKLTEGANQRQIRDIVQTTIDQFANLVEEAMPDFVRERADVCDIQTAIQNVHFPRDQEQLGEARGRLVYQELLILQLALAIRRHRVQSEQQATSLELTPKIKARILRRFPFELSDSQISAFEEIAADMNQPFPMNRMLHGDVGSGKTVVAVCSMLLAVAHGGQAALMAPTEILARQHSRTLNRMLAGSRVNVALITGSQTANERKALHERLEKGEVDIVVGTTAVINAASKFKNLSLVIIDEQHKFGVKQRAKLRGENDPHYLVMTATPIPRTISMTLFGDLDVSTLQRPDGVGGTVHTYLGSDENLEKWWGFFRKKLLEGRQGYVIAPLVDGGDESAIGSAERIFESLSNGPLEEFRIDLLHGRQSAEEKDATLQAFASGQTQVLVATGVVEVGIDVPNATVMTIQSAERFGLSQLHQLRGRVGRGKHAGYVCAFESSGAPNENERLLALEKSSDGFELAEIDMVLRGPGNLLSTRQSGFPPLMIADLVRDAEILVQSQQDARQIVKDDPELQGEAMERLHQLVFSRYGHVLDLGDVG